MISSEATSQTTPMELDLSEPTSNERMGGRTGGQGKEGKKGGSGPISEGRGRGGRRENGGRVSHPHVRTKLRSLSQRREQWRRGKRGGKKVSR